MLSRFLSRVERVGNALPAPATLFALLSLIVLLASWFASAAGFSAVHPTTGATVLAVNLFSLDGLHRIVSNLLPNFIQFPPLAVVLVALLGISVAESTGLIRAFVRMLVLLAPRCAVTALIIFTGVLTHVAGDVGYVLLIPLAGFIFHALGRHPVAGLAAAFAGVSGGFAANVMISTSDVLLAGLTQSAAQIVAPGYVVTPLANYYFMAAASLMVTGVGTWVTERIIEPRLGPYNGPADRVELERLSRAEKRGLLFAGIFLAGFLVVVLTGVVPEGGFLRSQKEPESVLKSLLLSHLVPFLFIGGLGSGIAFGLGARTIRSDSDVVKGMEGALATMGPYLVLAFFAAQFIAWFNWSNLGLLTAINGASLVKATGLEAYPIPLMVALVLFSAAMDLLIGSASAKWALLAPIFVPLFMLLGYSPELTQAAYRIGDSCSNVISPLMTYFPLMLTFVHRYLPSAGVGTLIATMLPYTLAFLIFWTAMLGFWIAVDLPLGPGVGLTFPVR